MAPPTEMPDDTGAADSSAADSPAADSPQQPADAWRQAPVATFVSTVAGIGFVPGGPGTYAAAAVLPALLWMSHWPWWWRLAALAVVTAGSIPAAGRTGQALGVHDSNHIVIDEVVGVWVALVGFSALGWPTALVGFGLFRLFDITKPPPARRIDDAGHGGLAVIADDIVAGIWAIPFIWAFRWWWTQ